MRDRGARRACRRRAAAAARAAARRSTALTSLCPPPWPLLGELDATRRRPRARRRRRGTRAGRARAAARRASAASRSSTGRASCSIMWSRLSLRWTVPNASCIANARSRGSRLLGLPWKRAVGVGALLEHPPHDRVGRPAGRASPASPSRLPEDRHVVRRACAIVTRTTEASPPRSAACAIEHADRTDRRDDAAACSRGGGVIELDRRRGSEPPRQQRRRRRSPRRVELAERLA